MHDVNSDWWSKRWSNCNRPLLHEHTHKHTCLSDVVLVKSSAVQYVYSSTVTDCSTSTVTATLSRPRLHSHSRVNKTKQHIEDNNGQQSLSGKHLRSSWTACFPVQWTSRWWNHGDVKMIFHCVRRVVKSYWDEHMIMTICDTLRIQLWTNQWKLMLQVAARVTNEILLSESTPLSFPLRLGRRLGSLTAAISVSFDFIVSCSSCWGWSSTNTLKTKVTDCHVYSSFNRTGKQTQWVVWALCLSRIKKVSMAINSVPMLRLCMPSPYSHESLRCIFDFNVWHAMNVYVRTCSQITCTWIWWSRMDRRISLAKL